MSLNNPATPITGNYAQAYFGNASSWSTTSATYVDGTNAGGNTLTVRTSSGIILTPAATSICGISFTPASSSAIYLIIATYGLNNGNVGTGMYSQMTDGTTVISAPSGTAEALGNNFQITTQGIYAPGTASAVTVKIQIAAGSNTTTLQSLNAIANAVEWTILRIF